MQTNDLNVAAGAGALHPSRVDNVWSQDAPAATSPTWCHHHENPARCATYDAIKAEVHPGQLDAFRVTFHGEYVATCWSSQTTVAVIEGLHAGAHLEARQWRWTRPIDGMDP